MIATLVKNIRFSVINVIVVLAFIGCANTSTALKSRTAIASKPFPGYEKLSELDRVKADTLIAKALDHEALYSLMADLKPISSIGYSLSYPLGKDSTQIDGTQYVVDTNKDTIKTSLEEIESWNKVLKAMSFDDYQFVLIPYKRVWKGDRNMQILLCRTDLIDSVLVAQAPFFAQWGFVPGTDPSTILTAIEFEERNDRYRAYGYLFGYPEHAVNFFVEASQQQQANGEFVQRSFFQIPVHARETGHFTYALPKDFIPLASDSVKYVKATNVLHEYRTIRPNFVSENNQLDAINLYRNWWKKKASITSKNEF